MAVWTDTDLILWLHFISFLDFSNSVKCPCNVTHDSVTLIFTFLIIIIITITIIISVQFISHSDFSLHTSVSSQLFKEKWGYYLHLANSNFTQCKPSITQQQSTQRRKTVLSRRIWTISRGKLQNFVNWPPAEFGKLSAENCGPYLFTTASEVGSKLPRNNRKIWHKSWPHK